jgi:hypothetical protein
MNYLRFTQYAYLIAAILFGIDAFQKSQLGETNKTVFSAFFSFLCVLMFFFRGNYVKRFSERNKKI